MTKSMLPPILPDATQLDATQADEPQDWHPNDRRGVLLDLGAVLASFGVMAMPAAAQVAPAPNVAKPALRGAIPLHFPGHGPIPRFARVFHLFTGPDGLTRAEQLPTNAPLLGEIGQFLRRKAERVTVAGSAAGAGFDFHVANQPTLLIPIFGSMVIGLADGTTHELRHGDLAYAEDCSGKGHISRAGAQGSFMVSVQLPKPFCPANGSSDRAALWTD